MDGRLVRQPSLKKFDGAARSCNGWEHLRKVRELLPDCSDDGSFSQVSSPLSFAFLSSLENR